MMLCPQYLFGRYNKERRKILRIETVERYSIYTCITVVEIQNYIPGLGPGPHGTLFEAWLEVILG